MWKTKVHSLKYQIQHDGKQIAAVTVREPDVQALETIDDLGIVEGKRPTIKQSVALVAAMADVPIEVIRKLHKADFQSLMELVVPLMMGEPEETSSS